MRRSFAVGVLAASTVTAIACFDTSELEGGSSDASDAQVDDTNVTGDSQPGDAAVTRDGSTTWACDAQFCESFDPSTSLSGGWAISLQGDASVAVAAKGLSAPNALEIIQPQNSGGTAASIVHVFAGPAYAFHCELDMKWEDDPQVGNEVDYLVMSAKAIPETSTYEVFLARFGPSWMIAEYTAFADGGQRNNNMALSAPVPVGAWTHVIFESDGNTLTATFDGNPLGILPLSDTAKQAGLSRSLSVGFDFTLNNTGTMRALYDNVACSFPP